MPLSVLTSSPFNLVLGDSVDVIVTAQNVYGDSLESAEGSGANIVLVPDAPITLADAPGVTTASQIGLTWAAGASSGGKPILDYRVYFDQSTNNWIELEDSITTRSYTTTTTLIRGRTYKFKVQARNSVGYSDFSNEVSILAAEVPAKPVAPTTTISDLNVVISWSTPDNGGSPITSYVVKALHGSTFTEVTCDEVTAVIVSSTTCTVPIS